MRTKNSMTVKNGKKGAAANNGFGVMAALRIYPDRYNIAERHIQLTNKS